MSSKTEKIKQVILEAFSSDFILVSGDETRATFEVHPDSVTFKRLERIAVGLNTKSINVGRFGECDRGGTYGGSSRYVELEVSNIPD